MIRKRVILFLGICFPFLLQAQEPATIECRIGDKVGKEIFLFRVEDGRKIVMANAVYQNNGYYGFKFIPTYEGFYVVGDKQNYQYPLYLKGGDAVSVHIGADSVYLLGKNNTPENKMLYEWVAL
ncbi:MAG: hypothetical protein NC410_11640, partial [Oscillibacter sp.]|nr:hypothetical protein [Oscillibacter sp.]